MKKGQITQQTLSHINKVYGRFLVLDIGKTVICSDGTPDRYFICRCECGTIKEVCIRNLRNKGTQSCGCIRTSVKLYGQSQHINQRFGKLTVIADGPRVRSKVTNMSYRTLVCRCDCGGKITTKTTNLTQGDTLTCGNCQWRRNGILTSYTALKLNEMIPEGLHNYFTDIPTNNGRTLNIDIALPLEKIAIEYDSIKWHNNEKAQIQDNIKTQKLINSGWKVLRIISNNKLPRQAELDNYINELKTTDTTSLIVRIE